MAKVLGWVAVGALALTLALTIASIWLQRPSAGQFLAFTQILLSWPVLGAGLVGAAGAAFQAEIKRFLTKRGAPVSSE